MNNLELKKNLPISIKTKHKEIFKNIIIQLVYLSKGCFEDNNTYIKKQIIS